MRLNADVIVVGGGPAGASTAFQLARRGLRVSVLERARFPRAKPCAECLSPQASRILHDMDVMRTLEPQGAQLRGMVLRAPNGVSARGEYAAAHGFRAFRDRGLAIRRELLDTALLDRAREAGAHVEHGVRVVDVACDDAGAVRGVHVLASSGKREHRGATLVVGADGLRSIVARRLGLAHSAVWPRRISLVAHFRDVRDIGEYVELHVERDGFVGIADVGDGVTTVAAVFPARRARELAGDRSGFLDRWLASKRHLAARFDSATRVGTTAAIGPFASHATRAWYPGAVLVGDAADFFDPFTGEGIYSALRGGELAASAIAAAIGAASERDARNALRSYEAARRAEFGGKWWVERLIGAGVAFAPVVNRATRALAARQELADLLAGVTGDFVPARRVLDVRYLARLLVLPIPTPRATTA